MSHDVMTSNLQSAFQPNNQNILDGMVYEQTALYWVVCNGMILDCMYA